MPIRSWIKYEDDHFPHTLHLSSQYRFVTDDFGVGDGHQKADVSGQKRQHIIPLLGERVENRNVEGPILQKIREL